MQFGHGGNYKCVKHATCNISVTELHDTLKNSILSAQQNAIFSFEGVTGLGFGELAAHHKAQFVEENEEE